ncbi:MAG: glycosyltransferase family 4 protein [Clostridiales bacterium]|nr:glycosyltransferase family 4 protein [Clostridiales bacterium]
MKIAVDVLSIRPDGSAGGAMGFALELIKGFAAKPDIQVLVLCADWNISYLKGLLPKNIQYYQVLGEYKLTGIGRIDRIVDRIRQKIYSNSVLKKNNVDVLYCPFSAATYKEKGIPTVSTILDIQHEYYPQFFEPQELAHRRKFYHSIVKKVERVVCISDYTKETFCEKYKFPLDRAQTIYIAIQNRFFKQDDKVLDKLNLRGQEYIVYPANFWEHKNHKLLLNAFAMYRYENKYLKLVLTGNPLEQSTYYNNLLKAMKIDECTVITGYVTDEELYSILKNAKGLIYPSLFEGFGIPIVEAMHLHKLIACSNLTSLPEIGCDAIFYFNPKKPDDILAGIRYLAENEMTNDIIQQYETKLNDYKTEKMVEEYLKVLKDVVSKKEALVFQEEVIGVYPDGWSTPEIVIQLKDREDSILRGKIILPEFTGMKMKILLENNGKRRQILLKSGDSIELEEKITSNCATVILRMSKTWSPQEVLKNNDVRELGVFLEDLKLETADEMIEVKNLV